MEKHIQEILDKLTIAGIENKFKEAIDWQVEDDSIELKNEYHIQLFENQLILHYWNGESLFTLGTYYKIEDLINNHSEVLK